MNTTILVLAAVAILFLVGLIGALVALARERGRSAELDRNLAGALERGRLLEDSRATMGEFLRAQAAESAQAVAQQLVARADESFKAQEELAKARMEAQLKPVADALSKFELQVQEAEKARAEQAGGLKAQIEAVLRASTETQFEARKLSAALRRGAGVQGRWGEQTLLNVLEVAGLSRRFDFSEQTSTDTEEGRRRPDVTVRLPGGAVFVIDAKCSLNAFLEGQDAADDIAREGAYLRHAQSVRGHMQGLSAKAYWDQFDTSPDFVAMFVPGDGFLAAALDRLPDLMTEAMDKRVLLVTPTTLFALCKAVAYGWRVEEQAVNAGKIAEAGRDLHKRIGVMTRHVLKLGENLTRTVNSYNDFTGSLERNVLTQARRFETLAADSGQALPSEVPTVDEHVKALSKLVDVDVDLDEAAALPGSEAA